MPSFEDDTIKVVFVEMAGEDIDGLILLQERWHDTIQVQPVVEYQDGLLCFQHETAMEYVGQRHCCSISQSLSSQNRFYRILIVRIYQHYWLSILSKAIDIVMIVFFQRF